MSKQIYGVSPSNMVIRCKLMNSSVATGAGLKSVAYNTPSLIISAIKIGASAASAYTSNGSTIETISTLGTYAAPTAGKCRFKEVDSTNHQGIYELQFDNGLFENTDSLLVSISGAANLAEADFEIECKNVNSNVIKINGTNQTARDIGASVLLSSGTGTGQLDFTSGIVKSNLNQILGTLLTETDTGYLSAAFEKLFDVAIPASSLNDLATLSKLLKYAQLLARSDSAIQTDNATEFADINADEGSGAGDYDNITDSLEAISGGGSGICDANLVSIDGLATSSYSANLKLNSLSIINSDGTAVYLEGSNEGNGLHTKGHGSSAGFLNEGGISGNGQSNIGGADAGDGLYNSGVADGGVGQTNNGGASSPGLRCYGGVGGGGTGGAGIETIGGVDGGSGLLSYSQNDGYAGMHTIGYGSSSGTLNEGGVTGHGQKNIGGATSGNGLDNEAQNGTSHGVYNKGHDSGSGMFNVGGDTYGDGLKNKGGGTGAGQVNDGGDTYGNGLVNRGSGTGGCGQTNLGAWDYAGLHNEAGIGSNADGQENVGKGTGCGTKNIGGENGHGLENQGGSNSGNGITSYAQGNGHGMSLDAGTETGNMDLYFATPSCTVPTVLSANVDSIANSTDSATKLKTSAETMRTGTVDNTYFVPTATEFEADIADLAADYWNDRWIIFTSGALIRQAKPITDYSQTTGRGHFTVSGFSSAPSDNDTFIIV